MTYEETIHQLEHLANIGKVKIQKEPTIEGGDPVLHVLFESDLYRAVYPASDLISAINKVYDIVTSGIHKIKVSNTLCELLGNGTIEKQGEGSFFYIHPKKSILKHEDEYLDDFILRAKREIEEF